MKLCPKCGELISFNSYFGTYKCVKCKWTDDSFRKQRTFIMQGSSVPLCSISAEIEPDKPAPVYTCLSK